jgi:calcineurin-like phosphoesterase family protein
MNEHLVEAWNKEVTPKDIVWHLGDVTWGNHDSSSGLLNPVLEWAVPRSYAFTWA